MFIKIFLISLVLISSFGCKTKSLLTKTIDGISYTSIKSLNAKGDSKTDDVKAIQNAFDKHENIYFPSGKYLINSATPGEHNPESILISSTSAIKNIYFEKNAELYINNDFNFSGEKNSIIKILTTTGDIPFLKIKGLKIFAENKEYSKKHTGIFAIEKSGYEIKNLQIEDASFYNLSGAGIITYALKTTLNNIYTENTASHGIGALNPYNLGREHFLFIDGYLSVNDKAYSIDFSGTSDIHNEAKANPNDNWTGIVKNVKSINSLRGIKTAGYWNLYLENIEILNSKIYGFFINKDAPEKKIQFKNLKIENSGDAGLSLSGKTKFEGENLSVVNCPEGVIINGPEVKIDGFLLDGKGTAKKGLRFQNNGEITNFKITGIQDDYAVWLTGKNIFLKNGEIYNNNCSFGLLVHENPENVVIENVSFYDDRVKPMQLKSYLVIQKKGTLKIKHPNNIKKSTRDKNTIIDNRSNIKIEEIWTN